MAEASVDKSVVNWLMHVISGKQPIEMRLNETPDSVAGAAPDVQEPKAAMSPIAVVDIPREEEPVKAETVAYFSTFTAEDLCGAPVFKAPEPEKKEEEFTAEDLCGAPVFTIKPEPKSSTNGVVDIFRAPGPQLVETPKHEVTSADITRDTTQLAAEPPESAAVLDILQDQPAAEAPEHEITAADITRSTESYASESGASGAAVAEVDWLPAVQPGPVPAESPTGAPAAGEIVVEPEHPAVEPDVNEIAATAANPEAEMQPTVHPEPEVVESEPAAVESAAPFVVADPEVADPEVADQGAGPVSVEENAVPPEASWPGPALTVVEPATQPMHVPQLPIAEPEIEHAVSESSTGDKFRISEPNFFHEPEQREAGASAGDAYREPFYRDTERLYPDPEILKEIEEGPEGWANAWKGMMRLGSVLPWVARLAPLFEGGIPNEQTLGAGQEVRHEVAGLRLVQYEIKTTIQDHSLQLKRLEDQLTRVRESVESDSSESAAVMDSMKSTVKLVRMVGIGVGALLLVLIVMVGVVLAHGH